ncbi:sulfatase-like hydrolase/transferase [candidate division KSB1 bacterium]|nr:sulfatase-like hydrolase/transferase [candidate division KSB1 bacterium]RQW08630.1 MAG: hypothetical protein EH222_05475 [candidate division KSB1 bacterium]
MIAMFIRMKNSKLRKTGLSHTAILILSFLLFGLVEIYNNVIFKLLHVDVFPTRLFTQFLPLLGMYALKSMHYAVPFLLVAVSSALARDLILLFIQPPNEERQSLSGRIQHILTVVHDLLIPGMLIYILFFHYRGGPVTLAYYFYFLSDKTSPVLKNLLSFGQLTLFIKMILALCIAFVFIRFRAAKYARHYILIALILVVMAILPNLAFLLHHVSGLLAKGGLILLIVVLFITVLLLLRRLFAAGIPRWVEIGWTFLFIILLPATIYLFSATKNDRPNIVHIILDTLRMKSFNKETMPFLYSLKDKGIYFPSSYSSSDNTVTSHNAIYYGKHPSNIGMEHGPFPAKTIMDVLRTNEYHTVVVSANGRFCIVNGFDKGVEDFYEAWKTENHVRDIQLMNDYGLSDKFTIIADYWAYYTDNYLNRGHFLDKKPMGHREYRYFNYEPAKVVNEFVKHVIEKNPPSTPFYLFVNYLDPHAPYLAPTREKIAAVVGRLKTCLPDIYARLGFEHIALSDSMIFQQIMLMWNEVDSLEDQSLKSDFLTFCYEENINYLDEQMRSLFGYFEDKKLFKNTLFIITSDHGESIGEHDLYDHGNKRLYNTEIKVPLFLLLPDKLKPFVKKKSIDINTQSVDFYPTILDLLGIKTDVELNGKSLLPYLLGLRDSGDDDYAIAEYIGVSAITDNTDKLIVRGDVIELYHLADDPDEENNLAARMPEAVRAFKKTLESHRKANNDASQTRLTGTDERRYDPETSRLLKTLGYLK